MSPRLIHHANLFPFAGQIPDLGIALTLHRDDAARLALELIAKAFVGGARHLIAPGRPVDSMRLAVLTVSPQRS